MTVLFSGREGSERVVVELRRSADGGVVLESQSIGPMAARIFGDDEVESFLTIPAAEVARVVALLRPGTRGVAGDDLSDALRLLTDRYAGDSAATTHLRQWLDAHGIAYEFFVT
jgi:hypothetical protein